MFFYLLIYYIYYLTLEINYILALNGDIIMILMFNVSSIN